MGASDIQVEDGNFTRIHNKILEKLVRTDLTLREMKIVLHVIRMTYGYQRTTYISTTAEVSKSTGIHPNHVRTSLNRLIKANVILTERGEIGFNKDFSEWVLVEPILEDEQPNRLQPNQLETTESVATKSVASNNQISCSEQPNRLQKTTKSVADRGLKSNDGAGPGNPKEKRKYKENSKESADPKNSPFWPHLEILSTVKGYPYEPATDIDWLGRLEGDYPTVDILAVIKKWADGRLGKPIKSDERPRSQIRTWVSNAKSWGQDLKPVNSLPTITRTLDDIHNYQGPAFESFVPMENRYGT